MLFLKNRLMKMIKFLGIILFLFNCPINAQIQTIKILKAGNNEVYPKKKLVILWKDVVLEHNGNIMHCDSAVVYKSDNSFLAYRNILIEDNESIVLSGDSLKYFGDEQKANIRGSVQLISKEINLYAPSLDYNLKNKIAFFNHSAEIENKNTGNKINSNKGRFNTLNNILFFKEDVVLTNTDYTIQSDTLVYNTVNEISQINGQTTIVTNNSNIFCHQGWFDSKNNISSLKDSILIKSETHTLSADSLFYNETLGQADVFGHVVLKDDTSHWEMIGERGFYDEKIDSASVYGNSMLTQINKEDTLKIFADKFITKKVNDYYELFCFHNVSIFGTQLNGICDSLYYYEMDSLMYFYVEPVLWIEESQMTGDLINFKINNGKVYNMEILDNSFIITQKDSIHYDQIKGDYINANFIDNKLSTMYINGKGKVIYFSENENNNSISDANKVKCEKMKIKFIKNNIKEVIFQSETSGNSAAISESEKYELDGFKVYEKIISPKGD
jgi:lipopolysaccharide export system protein LptA